MAHELLEVQEGKTVIDRNSHHLFQYGGDKMLYDLATGVICELNDFTYRLLSLCGGHSWAEVLDIIAREYPGVREEEISAALDSLKGHGFFRYKFSDGEIQHSRIDGLWGFKPRMLQLFLAQKCNLACRYCYAENSGSNARNKLMSWEVAKGAVDYLVSKSGERRDLRFNFFGGEPLLNYKVLQRAVSYCEELSQRTGKKFSFELSTNGILLSREVADYFAERDFRLCISIDGWREMHNDQRLSGEGKDYYDTILHNAKYAVKRYRELKSRIRVKVRANLTCRHHDLRKTAEYLEDQGFEDIGICSVVPLCYEDETPCALTEEQMDIVDSDYEQLQREILSDLEQGKRLGPYRDRYISTMIALQFRAMPLMGITCGIGRNSSAVDCEGNIYPCHRYVGMEKYIMGNIFSGLSPSRTIGLYHKYHQCILKECSGCWAHKICGGGCAWERAAPDGIIYNKTSSHCERFRKTMETFMWLDKEMRKRCPGVYSDMRKSRRRDDERFNNWRWDE
ncbi:MAG: hypothetical protein AMJ79_14740 [Phycisphaerae bacterium SM23_30]|nr:MAG: hypothetical protein AMJ79_14740 [Phycisphaerae bacterium SM23_30]